MFSSHHWLEEGAALQVINNFFVWFFLSTFLYFVGDIKRTNNNTISNLSNSMGNSASVVEVSEVNILTFYENYHEASEDYIAAEGIIRLCSDLELAADDFRILLFAWKCDAAQMGRIKKQEFLKV